MTSRNLRLHGWASTIELSASPRGAAPVDDAAGAWDLERALGGDVELDRYLPALVELLDERDLGERDRGAIVAATLAAVRCGRLVARRIAIPAGDTTPIEGVVDLTDLAEAPEADRGPVEPTPEGARVGTTTWFEATIVDELGEGIEGVPVIFHVDGTRRTIVSDGGGLARLDDAEGDFAVIELEDTPALREPLHARWRSIRDGAWLEPGDDRSVLQLRRTMPEVSVRGRRPHVISMQQRLVLARLLGMLFDTDKTFLLPTALGTIRSVKQLYDENHGAQVLAVGHTDSEGDPTYNLALSSERATILLAYLADDVATWLERYTAVQPAGQLWGATEDAAMIAAMPDAASRDPSEPPVLWYQRTRGLDADGVAGPNTRERLVAEYMAADDTSLPAGAITQAHGCGEGFPAVATNDGTDAQENRRVELFLFEDEVLPPAPGPTSAPEDPEYPEWQRRARETHDYIPGDHVLAPLVVAWSQAIIALLPADTTLTLVGEGITEQTLTLADGVAEAGVVGFAFQDVSGAQACTLTARAGGDEVVLWRDQTPTRAEPPLEWLADLAQLVADSPEDPEEVPWPTGS